MRFVSPVISIRYRNVHMLMMTQEYIQNDSKYFRVSLYAHWYTLMKFIKSLVFKRHNTLEANRKTKTPNFAVTIVLVV